MALALAELAEGAAAEEGEAAGEEGFESDSPQNAESGGVEIEKILSAGLSLASSILSLVTAIKKGGEQTEDIRERRYQAGLLTPTETRSSLLLRGEIPAYYAESNIHKLIEKGVLPYGWSAIVASLQGFGTDIQAFLLRQRMTNVAAEREADLKRRLIAQRIQVAADHSNREAATRDAVSRIGQSVVQ